MSQDREGPRKTIPVLRPYIGMNVHMLEASQFSCGAFLMGGCVPSMFWVGFVDGGGVLG